MLYARLHTLLERQDNVVDLVYGDRLPLSHYRTVQLLLVAFRDPPALHSLLERSPDVLNCIEIRALRDVGVPGGSKLLLKLCDRMLFAKGAVRTVVILAKKEALPELLYLLVSRYDDVS